jgi:hypothetical protein
MTKWLYIWGITIEAHSDDRNVLDYGVLCLLDIFVYGL